MAAVVSFRTYLAVRRVWVPLLISLLLNIAAWVYLLWFIRPGEAQLVLHYTIHFGVDYVGPWYWALQAPAIGLSFFSVNTFLSWWMWERIRILSHIFNGFSVLSQAVMLGVAVLLVILNS